MKIALYSDLHNEHRKPNNQIVPKNPAADIIILAGDNHSGDRIAEFAANVAEENQQATILWIPGNHEYYGFSYDERQTEWLRYGMKHPRVYFMDNDYYHLDGVSIICSTLWTQFDSLLPKGAPTFQVEQFCQRSIADFHAIFSMNSTKMKALHNESVQFIRKQIEMDIAFGSKTVIATHFAPTEHTQHRAFPGSELGNYFNAKVDDLMMHYQEQIETWLFGHTHCNGSDGDMIYNVPVHSNMMGYPGEAGCQDDYPSETGHDSGTPSERGEYKHDFLIEI